MSERQKSFLRKSWVALRFSSPDALVQFTLKSSVVLSAVLVLVKLYAYVLSDSLALFSTLIDSVLDGGISVANFYAARRAARPACAHYRFGHGKVESLAVLGQSAFIAASALFLLFSAFERFYHPEPLRSVSVGIGAMVFSMTLTFGLLCFQKYVIRLTHSTLVSVDYLHYVMDLLLGAAVIISLVLGNLLQVDLLDPFFALVISIYILVCAWRLLKKAVAILMDREFSEDKRKRIERIIRGNKNVLGFHELRTRSSGKKDFIQFHLELPDHLPLIEAHEITDSVEKNIQKHFPHAEILIHQDPVSLVFQAKCKKNMKTKKDV